MIAPVSETISHPAVIPTKPANIPFSISDKEGFPYLIHEVKIVAIPPAHAAKFVVMNTCEIATRLTSPDAANCEPGLKPNQPNQRIKTPNDAIVNE